MLFKRLFILFILLFPLINIISQEDHKPKFNLDALNFYSPDSTKTRLDVYIELPYENLSFVKSKEQENKFSTELDINISINDIAGQRVFDKTEREVILTEKTDLDYLNNSSQIITKNLYLNPGAYKIKVNLREISTNNSYSREKEVKIKDFLSTPVTISDVMLVSKVNEKNSRKYITPLVSRNVGSIDTAYMFFFIYLNKIVPYYDVTAKVFNSKNELVDSIQIPLDIKQGLEFENQVLFPFITGKFANDSYSVQVNVKTNEYTASGISSFESKIADYPVNLEDIDKAIEQLQYIATEDEMRRLEKAKTKVDKQKRFVEFWHAKDPSPNTERNEVMMEYYKRITYANKKFSTHYTDGWRTDMGMVYIIFGLPGNIERHPYEMDSKPYEIWDYYEINRQFIFVDYSGFGDYRLITPIWDTFHYK